ncbi:MAG: site-specific integrase [Desulfobacteraceae bacterium]|nr:MAG: site-specific integrase [Desulfobacteraceae bacterium]
MHKKNTVKNYRQFLNIFNACFGDRDIESITSDEILTFLTESSDGQKQSTKRFKYTLLNTFFNFIKNATDPNLSNPCDTPILRKAFRLSKGGQWSILEKDVVDEIIFKTDNHRNRLMLELMARGGMRIGEVLKLRAIDVDESKLSITKPKSGRQNEIVFIPQKVSVRLNEYIRKKGLESTQRIFPIGYTGAREMVRIAGKLAGIDLRPHDLRRHAATYASRDGAPLEIVSKIILRHANLLTTQRYLGKVSDTEAIRWIENIYR